MSEKMQYSSPSILSNDDYGITGVVPAVIGLAEAAAMAAGALGFAVGSKIAQALNEDRYPFLQSNLEPIVE